VQLCRANFDNLKVVSATLVFVLHAHVLYLTNYLIIAISSDC